jgi:hypothetical protein
MIKFGPIATLHLIIDNFLNLNILTKMTANPPVMTIMSLRFNTPSSNLPNLTSIPRVRNYSSHNPAPTLPLQIYQFYRHGPVQYVINFMQNHTAIVIPVCRPGRRYISTIYSSRTQLHYTFPCRRIWMGHPTSATEPNEKSTAELSSAASVIDSTVHATHATITQLCYSDPPEYSRTASTTTAPRLRGFQCWTRTRAQDLLWWLPKL